MKGLLCMVTMYNRAIAQYSQIDFCIGKVSSDTAYLDLACFDAQQALEFLMKHILIEHGVPFKKTHNIRYLLDLLNSIEFDFDLKDDLFSIADTITNWEEASRYGSGVRTTVNTINRAKKIFDSMQRAYLTEQEKNNSKSSKERESINSPECPSDINTDRIDMP